MVEIGQFVEYIGNHDDSTESVKLKNLYLESALIIVEKYLKYPLAKGDYIKSFSGSGFKSISLGTKKINTVSNVTIDGETVDITNIKIDQDIIYLDDQIFFEGFLNISVSFNAGYEANELPALIRITILRIAGILSNEEKGKVGIQSVSDSKTGSRTFMEIRFNKYLKILEPYRCIL